MAQIYGLTESFNSWIRFALHDLAALPSKDIAPKSRQIIIDLAASSVRNALAKANEMGCPDRKAMCMRILNWLRADAGRAP